MDDSAYPVTPAAIALPILALITLIIDALPMIWHIRNRNLAAACLVFWIVLANLMNFINPFIWPTDDISSWWPGYGLCDVEAKLQIGVSVGVISSLLCIMRNLARVLDTDRAVLSLSKAQQRKKVVIDCLLCLGAPAYMMIIHYIVQSSRYYIFAISGCTASTDPSWPTLVLVVIVPPIFCLVSLYYASKSSYLPFTRFLDIAHDIQYSSSHVCTATAKASPKSWPPQTPVSQRTASCACSGWPSSWSSASSQSNALSSTRMP